MPSAVGRGARGAIASGAQRLALDSGEWVPVGVERRAVGAQHVGQESHIGLPPVRPRQVLLSGPKAGNRGEQKQYMLTGPGIDTY